MNSDGKIYVILHVEAKAYARDNWFGNTWWDSSDRELVFSTKNLANKYIRKIYKEVPTLKKNHFVVKECEKEELFDKITKYIDS